VLCGVGGRRSKIVVEFYRIRETEKAYSVIGQETGAAADLDDAIEIAAALKESQHAAAAKCHVDQP